MKFAPIIDWRYDPAQYSNYHMILSHEVVEDKQTRDYYMALDNSHTVILDNGTVENGDPNPELLRDTLKFMSGMNAQLIVIAPDYIGDKERTVRATRDFLCDSPPGEYDIMIVPQGKDPEEWINCLTGNLDLPFDYIGLPRVTEAFAGGRQRLHHMASQFFLNDKQSPKFHLLGVQNTIWEVEWALHLNSVKGIDSSIPIRSTSNGLGVHEIKDLRSLPNRNDVYKGEWHRQVIKATKDCVHFFSGAWKAEQLSFMEERKGNDPIGVLKLREFGDSPPEGHPGIVTNQDEWLAIHGS